MSDFDDLYERGLVDGSGMPTWEEDTNDYNRKKKYVIKKCQKKLDYDGKLVQYITTSLTPLKYLSDNEKKMRNKLALGSEDLELVHESTNEYDSLALKVLYKGIKIGYLQKKNLNYDLNSFCFINKNLKKNLKLISVSFDHIKVIEINTNEQIIYSDKKIIQTIREIFKDDSLQLNKTHIHNIRYLINKITDDIESEVKITDFIKNCYVTNIDELNRNNINYNNIKNYTIEKNLNDENFVYSVSGKSLIISHYKEEVYLQRINYFDEIYSISLENCQNITDFSIFNKFKDSLISLTIIGTYPIFPIGISVFKNIKYLDIGNCRITTEKYFPSEITKLVSLTELSLKGISNLKIPMEIKNLKNLEKINLNNINLNLKEIPQEIVSLENLKQLSIVKDDSDAKSNIRTLFEKSEFIDFTNECRCIINRENTKNKEKSFFKKLLETFIVLTIIFIIILILGNS